MALPPDGESPSSRAEPMVSPGGPFWRPGGRLFYRCRTRTASRDAGGPPGSAVSRRAPRAVRFRWTASKNTTRRRARRPPAAAPRSGPHRACCRLHCRLPHPRLRCRPRRRPVAAPLPSPLPRSRRRAHTDAALAGLASGSACRHQQPTVPNGGTGAPRKSTAAASATATAVVATAAAAAGPAGLAQAGRNGGRMVPIIAASADANWCRVDRGDQYTFSHGSVTLPITRHAACHANTSNYSVTPTAKVP